jgi:hypothetical protein
MLSKQDVLERAFRAIEGLEPKPTMAAYYIEQESAESRPTFAEPLRVEQQVTLREGSYGALVLPRAFPHCPRCGSYYLYRKNNVGNYECQTCEMVGITEDVARRSYRA